MQTTSFHIPMVTAWVTQRPFAQFVAKKLTESCTAIYKFLHAFSSQTLLLKSILQRYLQQAFFSYFPKSLVSPCLWYKITWLASFKYQSSLSLIKLLGSLLITFSSTILYCLDMFRWTIPAYLSTCPWYLLYNAGIATKAMVPVTQP